MFILARPGDADVFVTWEQASHKRPSDLNDNHSLHCRRVLLINHPPSTPPISTQT